ncbi:seminal metalloprotease 1-like [Musca autumnalis]|uniref:seminal metalloprotease 1-like n=1 Tax=Musca autumnalis TaxID=221902 RepID=UPI003CF8BDE6
MEKLLLLVLGIFPSFISHSGAASLTKSQHNNEDYLLEDIILKILKNGEIAPARRWPNATVHYRIAEEFRQEQKDAIRTAMTGIENVSCVRFVEANETTTDYLNVIPSEQGLCCSEVGYHGRKQNLQLSMDRPKCFNPLVISHELLHALGFYHEHMTSNRDDYVTINWDNIIPGKEIFYRKLDNSTVTDFGYDYDYDSVLHYGPFGFSVNGLPTITPHDSSVKIGQRTHLSPTDIGKLNAMYNCPLKVVTENGENEKLDETENGKKEDVTNEASVDEKDEEVKILVAMKLLEKFGMMVQMKMC